MIIIVGSVLTDWLFDRPGAGDNRMAYVLGLQRLGHEVYLMGNVALKQLRDQHGKRVRFRNWTGLGRFERLMRAYGVWPRSCLMYGDGEPTHGLSFAEAARVAGDADLLINISGKLTVPEIVERVPCRVFVDIDPGKTQLAEAEQRRAIGLDTYHHFFSVGLNVGTAASEVPDCGVRWRPLRPPVVLDQWPPRIDDRCRRFTTVSNWRPSYLQAGDRRIPAKAQAWMEFGDLPRRTGQDLEIAARVAPGCEPDIAWMTERGWHITDARALTNREEYRDFIGRSRAEFSIANNRYVALASAWFSDRSARYLASGKPVLIQSTGVERQLPVGRGILTFTDVEEAVTGIENVNRDYLAHCRAARALAEEYFDSDKVLTGMLEQVGCGVR